MASKEFDEVVHFKKFPIYYNAFNKAAFIHWWEPYAGQDQLDYSLMHAVKGRALDWVALRGWKSFKVKKRYRRDFYRNTQSYQREYDRRYVDTEDKYGDALLTNLTLSFPTKVPQKLRGIINVLVKSKEDKKFLGDNDMILLRTEQGSILQLLSKYKGYAIRLLIGETHEVFQKENRLPAYRDMVDLTPAVEAFHMTYGLEGMTLIDIPANVFTYDYQLLSRTHELDFFSEQGILPLDVVAHCLIGFLDLPSEVLLLSFMLIVCSLFKFFSCFLVKKSPSNGDRCNLLTRILNLGHVCWITFGFLLNRLTLSTRTWKAFPWIRSRATRLTTSMVYVSLLFACFLYGQFFSLDLVSFMLRYHPLNIDSLADFFTYRDKLNLTLHVINDSIILDYLNKEIMNRDAALWKHINSVTKTSKLFREYSSKSDVRLAHPYMCELFIMLDRDWPSKNYHCSETADHAVKRYSLILRKDADNPLERNSRVIAPFLRRVSETRINERLLMASRIKAYMATFYQPSAYSSLRGGSSLTQDSDGLFTSDSIYRLLADIALLYLLSGAILVVELVSNLRYKKIRLNTITPK